MVSVNDIDYTDGLKVKDGLGDEYYIREKDKALYEEICERLDKKGEETIKEIKTMNQLGKDFLKYLGLGVLFFILTVATAQIAFLAAIFGIVFLYNVFMLLKSFVLMLLPESTQGAFAKPSTSSYLALFIKEKIKTYSTATGVNIVENLGYFERKDILNYEKFLWEIYNGGGDAIINFNLSQDDEINNISTGGRVSYKAGNKISGDIVKVGIQEIVLD